MASTENLMYPQDTNVNQKQRSVELMPTKRSEEHSRQEQEKGQQAPPKTQTPYLKSLALFNGRKTDESVFKLILRPFPLLFHPAILWGMLTQGALIGWTVLIGVVLGVIVSPPPFFILSYGNY